MRSAVSLLLCAVLCGGCSTSGAGSRSPPDLTSARSVGRGPRFRPPPTSRLVARASSIDGMRCHVPMPIAAAAHVEVFAFGHVVLIPAGIGVAPPLHRRGAYVDGGRCVYPLWTVEPTGLLLMRSARALTLGQLFELWGQPLSDRRVAGFPAPASSGVSVFIDGVRRHGSPSSAPIAPAAQITIEVGPYVPPHSRYGFPLQSAPAARDLR